MKWIKNTRGGSYVVEAVIVVPVFLIAVLNLICILPLIASCENIIFSVCDELHLESVKSAFRSSPAPLPLNLSHRIKGENRYLSAYRTSAYRYLYTDEAQGTQIQDLIQVQVRGAFGLPYLTEKSGGTVFRCTVTARAFTGTLHRKAPASADEEDDRTVYIFPEWGDRYHIRSCTYVKASCRMVYLSQQTMRDYSPCKVCNASSARIGSPVFCFSQSGRAYHLAECRMVERYYVEINRQKAREAGYTPCSKCGGGDK